MTYVQMDFMSAFTQAQSLQQAGTQQAVDHANAVSPKWSERAYQLLIDFLQHHKRFMGEDVRSYAAEQDFDLPPSARAWGGIIQRASKEYLIIKIGIQQVKNPKAHLANAAVWERNDERLIEMGLMK
jgi:hypothetical protein